MPQSDVVNQGANQQMGTHDLRLALRHVDHHLTPHIHRDGVLVSDKSLAFPAWGR